MNERAVSRFFGGPPLWVLARLIVVSILIGIVLSALGLDPVDVFAGLRRFAAGLWDMGWDAVRGLWRYFLLGAVLVVPIWLLGRIAKTTAGSR